MDGGVGARLREARLQRGIDLAEVEASTRVQARFLRAIESEEWSLLPSAFYARSFIRAYAAYLGLEDDAPAPEGLLGAPGTEAPADRSPRVDPAPPQMADSAHRRRLSPRFLGAVASVGLVAVLVAVGLSSDDSSGPPATRHPGGGEPQQLAPSPSGQPAREARATLTLTATAEVWVCLLDQRGQALINGQILEPGSEMGPYRSDGFVVSLGNGAVTMTVAGQAASIPPTPNPIGFSIDRDGTLRRLPEGERPTCT